MNNKVENPKTEVPTTREMNDRDYINDVLESVKNMSNNLSIALNEASNEKLFNEILTMFSETKAAQRDLYNMMFKHGWYCLERAEQQKISEELTKLNEKMNEIKATSN